MIWFDSVGLFSAVSEEQDSGTNMYYPYYPRVEDMCDFSDELINITACSESHIFTDLQAWCNVSLALFKQDERAMRVMSCSSFRNATEMVLELHCDPLMLSSSLMFGGFLVIASSLTPLLLLWLRLLIQV